MNAVRENCRKTVEEFVEDWLARENQWGEGKFRVVKVYFPGEAEEAEAIPTPPGEKPKGN